MSHKLPPIVDLTAPAAFTPANGKQAQDNSSFDLNEWHTNFKQEKAKQDHIAVTEPILPHDFVNPTALLYELIDRDIWRLRGSEVIGKYIGYSTKYKSLTVSLFDENDEVKTVCIRKAYDAEGNPVKWKTYGSKRYIPHRIFTPDDPVIFVGFGMGEFLLFELLELNYMALQSDSIAKSIAHNPYKPDFEDMYIFALMDNDESCRATIEPLKEAYPTCQIYGIDFANMLDKELPKGYDFRDFCNEVAHQVRAENPLAAPSDIKASIEEYLANEINLIIGGR